jgi:hypothetical protein
MSMVSHLHHLFNPDTCQSSIHTLRWKDRLLPCPRCQSHNIGPRGAYHYQSGLQRYFRFVDQYRQGAGLREDFPCRDHRLIAFLHVRIFIL